MSTVINALVRRTVFPVLVATLLALAGCAVPPAPTAPAETTKYTLENTDRFVLLGGAADHAISCTGLIELPLADGRLEVAANLKNREAQALKVDVGCVFKSAAGDAVIEDSPWQAVTLPENATVSVHFTAANPASKKYTIRVRDAR